MKAKNLNGVFYPSSVAVIGASNDVAKIGGFIFSQVKKVRDIKTYPINAKSDKIQGFKAYKSVLEIADKVDLAVVAVPSVFVVDCLKECVKAKIGNVVIISAGFKESGTEGIMREKELKSLIEGSGINVIGPNCLGILNVEIGLNCSFAADLPSSGNIAMISQSGAIIDGVIDWSFKHKIGFSKIVSLGNAVSVSGEEVLEYLKHDEKTEAIVCYLESISDGERFGRILREVSKKKPVVILKPGKFEEAKKAIGSHTGSLTQDDKLVQSLIVENGGIYVEDLNELFDVIIGFRVKRNAGKRIAILTNAGGLGVVATDAAKKFGFEIGVLSKKEKQMFDFLPMEASRNNPIDILGDARSDRFEKSLEMIDKLNVDNVLVLLTTQIMTDSLEIAQIVEKFAKKSKKCVFASFLGEKKVANGVSYLDKNGVACFSTPSSALCAISYLRDYEAIEFEKKSSGMSFNSVKKIEDVRKILANESGLLDYDLTKKVLDVLELKIFPKKFVSDVLEISKLKLSKNKSYVLKANGGDLIHKKDVGGVVVGVKSEEVESKVRDMFKQVSKVTKEFSISIEEEVFGTEVIVGLKKDESLGSFLMFGAGGTYVDLFEDINLTSCPLNKTKAKALVSKSKAFKLLNGFRGTKKADFESLYDVLIKVSYLQKVFPEIKEVDLNPVICSEKGVYLVDVKLIC